MTKHKIYPDNFQGNLKLEKSHQSVMDLVFGPAWAWVSALLPFSLSDLELFA